MPDSGIRQNGHEPLGLAGHSVQVAEQTRSSIAVQAQRAQTVEARPGWPASALSEVGETTPVPPPRPATERRPGIIDAFVNTCQRWDLKPNQQLVLLGYREDTAFANAILSGRMSLPSRDIEDRVGYVVGISLGLGALFGESIAAERAWLTSARRELGGKSALEFMLEGHMANLMTVAALVEKARGL